VTAIGAGQVTITASSEGRTGTIALTVSSVTAASITLNFTSATLTAGDTRLLLATVRDAQGNVLRGRSVQWNSSNLSIVNGYVSADSAVLTAVAAGTATITATIDGRSATAQITVVAPASDVCSIIAGAEIYATDNQFLGVLRNRSHPQSIYNSSGAYGSTWSATSIYATWSQYGGSWSAKSPWSTWTSTPPVLVKNGQAIAYFTMATFLTPRVSPQYAETCAAAGRFP
jgi:hypothetical protein